MTLIPLDYSIPFDKRTSDFYKARKAIVERGVKHLFTNPAEPLSPLMLQALVDEAHETRHKMEMKFPEAEIKAGGQETPPIVKTESPVQQSRDGALDGEELVVCSDLRIKLSREKLEAHNKEVVAQAVELVVERAIASAKEQPEPEKTTPGKIITLGFRLKPETLVPYDGEINEQTARDWIDKAERIFANRESKSSTPGSTDGWAAYLIGYLRLSSYEWACRRWPGNRKSARGRTLAYSDTINWEEFKREFILQHHPDEDLKRLKKQFQNLLVERSVREFNDQFRDLIKLINAATGVKDLTHSQAEGLTEEMKRARRAYLDRPLIAAYNGKLDRSLEIEIQRSRTHRPLSRLTEKWGRRWREYSELVPPYFPTLEEVMEYLEIIDDAINYPKPRSKAVKESKAAKAPKSG
jgi:hypothetical protein